jgi:hypothetical protein
MQFTDLHALHLVAVLGLGGFVSGWGIHLANVARRRQRVQNRMATWASSAAVRSRGQRLRLECFVTSHLRTLEVQE